MSPPHAPGVPGTRLPPAREVDDRDSREISEDSLLQEMREREELRTKAEARNAELEAEIETLKLAKLAHAPLPSPRPRAPSFSLGDAKWWALVIGALGAASGGAVEVAAKVHEIYHPAATAAQITDLRSDLAERDKADAKRDVAAAAYERKNDQRSRILGAFLCAQGLRAKGLDCDAAKRTVEFDPQPLTPKDRGAPLVWKTRSKWPTPPDPDPDSAD